MQTCASVAAESAFVFAFGFEAAATATGSLALCASVGRVRLNPTSAEAAEGSPAANESIFSPVDADAADDDDGAPKSGACHA